MSKDMLFDDQLDAQLKIRDRKVQREQCRLDCEAVCPGCRGGTPVTDTHSQAVGEWYHTHIGQHDGGVYLLHACVAKNIRTANADLLKGSAS